MIPYGRQWIEPEDLDSVHEVLRDDWITQGPRIGEFEERVAAYCGARHAVAVSSGTAALHLSCLALSLEPGQRLVTSPNTFVASANCAVYCGASPLFADIHPSTLNLDPEAVGRVLSSAGVSVRILLPVHFAGLPCEMEEMQRLAKESGAAIVEDAAHALGAQWKDRLGQWHRVGDCSHSDLTVLSFHPVKHITTGEGGMVLTNREDLCQRLKKLRSHGITRDAAEFRKREGFLDGDENPWYYEMQDLGFNYRITDFQCALGIKQLERLESFLARRSEIASRYSAAFRGMEEIQLPDYDAQRFRRAWHLFVIQLRLERLDTGRADFFRALRREGIGVNVHYIPVPLQPYYQDRYGYRPEDFPRAWSYYERAITLPLFPAMRDEQVDRTIHVVMDLIRTHRRARSFAR